MCFGDAQIGELLSMALIRRVNWKDFACKIPFQWSHFAMPLYWKEKQSFIAEIFRGELTLERRMMKRPINFENISTKSPTNRICCRRLLLHFRNTKFPIQCTNLCEEIDDFLLKHRKCVSSTTSWKWLQHTQTIAR